MRLLPFALMYSVSFLIACKRPASTQLAALENYVSGSDLDEASCKGAPSQLNSPSVDYFVRSAGPVDTPIANAIRDSVAAVPPSLRELVIGLGGRVFVTTDIARYCKLEDQYSKSERTPVACAKYIPMDAAGNQILGVFVVPDDGIIRRELVRQFGFLFSETISHMDIEVIGSRVIVKSLTHVYPGIEVRKTAIANSFFKDLIYSRQFNLDAVATKLGLNAGKIRDAGTGNSQDILAEVTNPATAQLLRDTIFAESFDSYFCNAYADVDPTRLEVLSQTKLDHESLSYLLRSTKNSRVTMSLLFRSTTDAMNLITPEFFSLPSNAVVKISTPRGLGLVQNDDCLNPSGWTIPSVEAPNQREFSNSFGATGIGQGAKIQSFGFEDLFANQRQQPFDLFADGFSSSQDMGASIPSFSQTAKIRPINDLASPPGGANSFAQSKLQYPDQIAIAKEAPEIAGAVSAGLPADYSAELKGIVSNQHASSSTGFAQDVTAFALNGGNAIRRCVTQGIGGSADEAGAAATRAKAGLTIGSAIGKLPSVPATGGASVQGFAKQSDISRPSLLAQPGKISGVSSVPNSSLDAKALKVEQQIAELRARSYHGEKPEIDPNLKHHDINSSEFRGGGSMTSVAPQNAAELYRRAIPDPSDGGRTWYARDENGVIHRYQGNKDNEYIHWNGSTGSAGNRKIRNDDIPGDVRRRFDLQEQADKLRAIRSGGN